MIEQTTFLKKMKIKHFMSLRDVEMQFKNLTVLVGPNASGKSNSLRALQLVNKMIHLENPPTLELLQDYRWAGVAESIKFQLSAIIDGTPAIYTIEFETESTGMISELLTINSINVIDTKLGVGTVSDEDGKGTTEYRPMKPRLALKSAGDYGNKPITRALREFIKEWEFYNFEPNLMRRGSIDVDILARLITSLSPDASYANREPKLDNDGSHLSELLLFWAKNHKDRFDAVNQLLKESIGIGIESRLNKGITELCLLEGYENPVPLMKCSDGTIRLVAYYALITMPDIPAFIAIEEPERNLHPAALKEIARALELLATRAQVVITTHSSQLLDSFNPELLADDLGVLLLKNVHGKGTEILNLQEIYKQRESLHGWINDFGIGSALFDSGLIP